MAQKTPPGGRSNYVTPVTTAFPVAVAAAYLIPHHVVTLYIVYDCSCVSHRLGPDSFAIMRSWMALPLRPTYLLFLTVSVLVVCLTTTLLRFGIPREPATILAMQGGKADTEATETQTPPKPVNPAVELTLLRRTSVDQVRAPWLASIVG